MKRTFYALALLITLSAAAFARGDGDEVPDSIITAKQAHDVVSALNEVVTHFKNYKDTSDLVRLTAQKVCEVAIHLLNVENLDTQLSSLYDGEKPFNMSRRNFRMFVEAELDALELYGLSEEARTIVDWRLWHQWYNGKYHAPPRINGNKIETIANYTCNYTGTPPDFDGETLSYLEGALDFVLGGALAFANDVVLGREKLANAIIVAQGVLPFSKAIVHSVRDGIEMNAWGILALELHKEFLGIQNEDDDAN